MLMFLKIQNYNSTSIFGTSTNGLASGNTIEEALLHGALEVIERDMRAFTKAGLKSFRISTQSLPTQGHVADIVTKIYNSGFELIVCCTPNESGIYYFEAYLVDPDEGNPASLCYGSAAHVCRDIALVRSITEAAQSRLTYIHGGRDDITKRFQHYVIAGKTVESQDVAQRKRELQNLPCMDLPKSENALTSIHDAINTVVNALKDFGLGPLLWVDLSNPRITLKVVRVIVPGAEFYKEDFQRVGPRLAAMLGVS